MLDSNSLKIYRKYLEYSSRKFGMRNNKNSEENSKSSSIFSKKIIFIPLSKNASIFKKQLSNLSDNHLKMLKTYYKGKKRLLKETTNCNCMELIKRSLNLKSEFEENATKSNSIRILSNYFIKKFKNIKSNNKLNKTKIAPENPNLITVGKKIDKDLKSKINRDNENIITSSKKTSSFDFQKIEYFY